jgi:AmiR/NasT family two-component response regulator
MTEQSRPSASRLLLVHNEPVIVGTIADCLRRAGFDVTTTTMAKEAVEFVRRGSFALVVIDYAMQDRSILDAAVLFSQLRQPFLFLSAYSEEPLVSAAVSAGALAYVVKPIDPIHLIPTIRTAISRAREMAALVEHNEQLTRTVDSNREVSVAVGLLMAQHSLPRRAAYEMLRQYARQTRSRLVDLAGEVAAGAEALFKIAALETPGRETPKTGDGAGNDST